MAEKIFDTSKTDSQATKVHPLGIADFPFETYSDYCKSRTERCSGFVESESGILVYRRMRVAEVFAAGCRDMKSSLELQLAALKLSMDFEADIPNFLEPWYGIGVVAGSFGIDYLWYPGQAPATKPAFQTIDDALAYDFKPVSTTEAGKHSLQMIEFFLEKTRGRLPISMGDIQSPFNNATNIVDTSNFLISVLTEPDKVIHFLDVIADLQIDFYKKQKNLIGDVLVRPGHGFASSVGFEGFGISDDNIVMIDADSYRSCISPSLVKLGNAFGGTVYHSCGNYSDKVSMLRHLPNLKMIDAAFTAETDPDPNPTAVFAEILKDTGIILNARIVGDLNVIADKTKELWSPGMKLIIVTYCPSAEEQKQAYQRIYEISQDA